MLNVQTLLFIKILNVKITQAVIIALEKLEESVVMMEKHMITSVMQNVMEQPKNTMENALKEIIQMNVSVILLNYRYVV